MRETGIRFREPYDGHSGCHACNFSGWIAFDKEFVDERSGEATKIGWSGACYCPRGIWLTQSREPKPGTGAGRPVLVNHAPREVYAAKLEQRR